MKKKHPGAQEELARGGHMFGELTTFHKAHPQVTDLEVEVRALPAGFGNGETYHYSFRNPPGQYTPCPNPACSGGGYNMGSMLAAMIHARQTAGENRGGCVGAEKMGRHGSRHCHYGFTAKVKLTYAQDAGDAATVD